MTDVVEARLRILAMTKPDVSNPALDVWLDCAKVLESYVFGQSSLEPPKKTLTLPPEGVRGQTEQPARKK